VLDSQYREFHTVFLSDLHIGWGRVSVEPLLDFLGHLRTKQLYLVGDILEWLYRPNGWVDESIKRFMAQLHQLTCSGTEITWLSGNHDESIYSTPQMDKIRQLTSQVRFQTHHRYMTQDGREFLLVHGDIYDHLLRRNVTLKQRFAESLYPVYVRLLDRFPDNRHVRKIQTRKLGDRLLADHASKFRSLMMDLAQSHGCDGVICGHIHVPDRHLNGSLEYFNCGDWLEHRTFVAESYSGSIDLYWK
jgi:UDP-2,3-diacylglucosamine pyrophosphatase LpxH